MPATLLPKCKDSAMGNPWFKVHIALPVLCVGVGLLLGIVVINPRILAGGGSFVLLVLCLVMISKTYGGIRCLSMPVLFFIFLVLFSGIGMIVSFDPASPSDWWALLMTDIGFAGFTLGSLLVAWQMQNRWRQPVKQMIQARLRKPVISDFRREEVIGLGILLACSLALVTWYLARAGGWAFYQAVKYLLSGSSVGSAQAVVYRGRQLLYYIEEDYFGQGFFDFVRVAFLPYVATLFATHMLITRSLIARTMGVLSVLGASLGLLALGQRWPLLSYFMILWLLMYHWLPKRALRISVVWGSISICMFFIGTVLTGRYHGTGDIWIDLPEILESMAYRVFEASLIPTRKAYALFPSVLDFKYGETWINDLMGYLPGPQPNFSVEYARLLGDSWGSAPLTAFGEMYVNFGALGVAIGSILYGVLVGSVELSFVEQRKRTVQQSVDYAFLSVGFTRTAYSTLLAVVSYALLGILIVRVFRMMMSFLLRPARRRSGDLKLKRSEIINTE